MLIREVIEKMKAYHKGEFNGEVIKEETTRDKILYGDPDRECTGIVTTCWATASWRSYRLAARRRKQDVCGEEKTVG